jgi:2'-5' RNA ligase
MRCFIALELDDAIKDNLETAQQLFEGIGGKVGWCSRQQMHLTLNFLGDVPDDQIPNIVEAITAAARQVPPFEFTVEKLGAFPPKGSPRVLWTGVSECPPLLKLQQLIEEALKSLGFEPEKRGFTPHLTLARVRERIDLRTYLSVLTENRDFIAGTQQTNKVILFASELKSTGAVYIPLAEAALGKR